MLFGKKKYEDPMKNKYAHLYVEHDPVYPTPEAVEDPSGLQPVQGLEEKTGFDGETSPDFVIRSPWRGIWFKPKETVQILLKGKYSTQAVAIAMLAGVTYGFNHAQNLHLGESLGLLNILTMSMLTGMVGGLCGLFGVSALLLLTGKWLGGKATYAQMWKTIGWASLPSAAASVLWFMAILIFGDEFFRQQMVSLQTHYLLFAVYLMIVLGMFFMRLWQLITMVACIAEVQSFSVKKAVFNVLLTVVVVMVPMVIVTMLFVG